jgi:hypothetical protein
MTTVDRGRNLNFQYEWLFHIRRIERTYDKSIIVRNVARATMTATSLTNSLNSFAARACRYSIKNQNKGCPSVKHFTRTLKWTPSFGQENAEIKLGFQALLD